MQKLLLDSVTYNVAIPLPLDSQKQTLVFLHDSLGCVELWRDFPIQLAQRTNCNVVIYDRQGYGKSDPFTIAHRDRDYLAKEAHTLNTILTALKLTSCILFGHSDGGSIALLAASFYPTTFKAIITEGAHVFVENETLQGILTAKEAYKTTNLKQKLERYHGTKTEAVFTLWTETWLSKEFQDWDITKELKRIQCPSLIIQGAQDEYGTNKQVEAIVNYSSSKHTEAYIIPNIGHSPHKECPNLVLEKVSEFIANLQ
ncbi:alpha/beta fold hydrolase [Aquimarina sp. 2-A2]|uniref:alpha/beta fold hydrolase n=1 Tax=Aquimarina sp. 2-A2 TaxID=3382644 RepID=UPI00387EFD6F